jgi:hypothetical protein
MIVCEVWKDVKGYEGLYQVSDFGNIKRIIDQYGYIVNRILVNNIRPCGHLSVVLSLKGKTKTRLVHHLVLEAFVGLRQVGTECRHLDGNPANNKLYNLKWGTRGENVKDAMEHGTFSLPPINDLRGSKSSSAKLNDNKIVEIRKLHAEGMSDTEIAKKYKVCRQTINSIINNKRWEHVK